MPKKIKAFQMPEQLLRSLDECTKNGFLLFSFNQNGEPDIHCTLDDATASLAMIGFVENWVTAVKQTQVAQAAAQMMGGSRKK